MSVLSAWVPVLVFLLSAVKLAEALLARRLVVPLPKNRSSPRLPGLAVVVPARNEERGLEGALPTLVGQEYPGPLRIVLVDDRSTDRTGEVMRRHAAGRPGVVVSRVEGLPGGWLGKNHAVHVGAARAGGEWVLLTDADVRFHPGALRDAVAFAEAEGLDHLTLVPRLELPGYPLQSFVAFFFTAFLVYRGYYRANLPYSGVGVGIGAFNLLRRRVFEDAGGYAARPLRPDDDLSLGTSVKALGGRQRLMLGQSLVSVPWYGSLREMVRGIEKNVFPALGYSLPQVAAYTAGVLLFAVWPFAAVLVTGGPPRALYGASILAQLLTFVLCNRFLGRRALLLALSYPACAAVFAAVLVRSTALALLRGGIYWRGTFYPLEELRRG